MIGRERLSDVQLQFAQKRFYSLKTIVENTPYARHLPQDIVCKLTDAVEIKEFAGGGLRVQVLGFRLRIFAGARASSIFECTHTHMRRC
jgi:hypothetical protein